MVEVLRPEKTTAEVVDTLDPKRQRPLLRSLQALGVCGPDDLEALFGRIPPVTRKPVELPNLHPFPTVA
ncbi:hypothetical protein A2867_01435 [Candidatus Daviesbacteria bacterium RIFCSPHIGHO2_01_FULL_40_11]|uniref:Uncharacterized protein n=1 Tax=Candidatus Daviesbacteria bacterium RIFCSPHIGHO2_01_FULL_40_11 TaxID=1797762 RepID=A0A1F5JGD0_9BACT|nr:MAG: hypothetical protein A2867_01435 [Candidatus Daviesbacteria bacterium RIFCSPHIGHO2_01_FULL_40_11]OGE62979.1 MAG: hypothetical protein A2964_02055 [Candidatus Daviesbacteria bacterium RIFCSPLOWO2_01_FULL_40_27]